MDAAVLPTAVMFYLRTGRDAECKDRATVIKPRDDRAGAKGSLLVLLSFGGAISKRCQD
jgi:hypothetical protein